MSLRLSALLCLIVGLMTAAHAQFEIQRANLHIHTSSSWRGWTIIPFGGLGDHEFCVNPLDTVAWADIHGLDVVGFSDHAESLVPWEWNELGQVANNYGGLTALRGFEWTGSDHVNVFGTESWCGNGAFTGLFPIENGAPPNPNITTVSSLMAWLQTAPMSPGYGPTPVAQFNHAYLYNHFGGFPYDPVADRYFRLIELGSVDAEEPLTGELYHPIIESQAEYHQALATGWHVAPSIGADNQLPPKWADRNRHTAIYTPVGGGREGVMQGLRARRVFASESQDFQLDYRCRVEGQTGFPHWMGEQVFLPNGKSTTLWIVAQDLAQIDYVDVMTPFGQIRRYGSINDTYFATTLTLTPAQLRSYGVTANDEACVYLRIHFENGNDAISAPIWFKDRTYVSGTQPEDWVWTEDRSPYIINGTFTVPPGRTLTIEQGVVIKAVNPSPMSIVVHGQLIVQGAPTAPVTFTSVDDHSVGGATGDGTPAPGDWPGIALYGEAGTQMSHAEIRYASSGIEGKPNYWQGTIAATDVVFRSNGNGISVLRWNETNPASVSLERCRFESSANMGCYISNGGSSTPVSTTLVDCAFIETAGLGLGLGGTRPTIRGCRFEGNGVGFNITGSELVGLDNLNFQNNDKVGVFSSCSGELSMRNTAGANNTLGVDFFSCWITVDTVLSASSAIPSYVLLRPNDNSSSLGVASEKNLTIEPGVVIKGAPASGRALEVHGHLIVQGTPTAPVTFTSVDDHSVGGATGDGTPAPGDWPGIALYGEAGTQMSHAEIRYASSGIEGKPNYWQGTIAATDVVFRSNGNGIVIQRWNEVNPASISLERCRFESSANMGLYVWGGGSSAPITASIVGCEFIESTGIGMALHNSARPVVYDCQFLGNGVGFQVASSDLVGFDNLNFQNNDKVGLLFGCSGDLSLRNTTGANNTLGVDFHNCWITVSTVLTASSAIQSYVLSPSNNSVSLGVVSEKTLAIEPGVIVKGGSSNNQALAVYGQLVVRGTSSAPVIFTSVDDHSVGGATGDGAPDMGNWKGISLYGESSAYLDHAEVRYASTGLEGMANYWQGTIKATNCRLRACYTGIRIDRWGAPNSAFLIVARSAFDSGGAGITLTNLGSSGSISADIRNSSFRLGTYGIAASGSNTSLHVQNSTFDRITYGASLNVSDSTWVHNSYSACGVAIKSYGGANQFGANVISRCDTGIENQSSYSIGYANVFFDNNSNYIGIDPGKGDQYVDPRFVDVDNGDLHLRSDSPCIDLIPFEWISPTILDDIDRHKRPVGEGFEPGADEVTDGGIVLPNVFQVAPGRIESGGLSDLFEADESRLLLEASRVRGSNDDLILALEGIAENPHPLDLRLLFTLAADVPGATYQVEFFNFESQTFEVVRSTPCPLSDTSFEAGVYVKAGRFVEPGTGRLKARLRFRLAGGAPKTSWHVRLDQAVWRLGQP